MRATILFIASLCACDAATTSVDSAAAPTVALGADGVGTDRADSSCRVALVEAGRIPDGRGGFELQCEPGEACRIVVRVDVRAAPGSPVHVLYRTSDSNGWHAAAATSENAGVFRFDLARHMARPDWSGTTLSRFEVELIPYLALDDGGRLFDHNRLPDPFANYTLTVGNGFSVPHLDACAPASGPRLAGPEDPSVDWAGQLSLYRARAGDAATLAEPFEYAGFSNMGFSLQVAVYAEGLTAGGWVDTSKIKVFFESDLLSCTPGGALELDEVPLALGGQGPFGNDAVFRQPIEPLLTRCPRGDYRVRFLISADGGLTARPLGQGVDLDDPLATAFRNIHSR